LAASIIDTNGAPADPDAAELDGQQDIRGLESANHAVPAHRPSATSHVGLASPVHMA
jgi:hypothetical protein